jgi:ferredoxin
MSVRANPDLLLEIQKYGDVHVEDCFNCGNCTAVCPLSTESSVFPRQMVRLAQVGLEDRLLSSEELWLCYYCGECTETCPREADPGAFMAAARRYAIAKYDRTGLAKALFTMPAVSTIILAALAAVLALFMYTVRGPMPEDSLQFFAFIPAVTIHNLGLVLMVLVALAGLAGAANMWSRVWRASDAAQSRQAGARLNWGEALWQAAGVEALGQQRYRQDCTEDEAPQPWYKQAWFIHAACLWGFLGLLAATSLNYGMELLGIKETGTAVPLWYPVRLLGTAAGALLLYGATYAIIRRLRKSDEMTADSQQADWIFLILLWLSGVTGFVIELALYLPRAPQWGYWMFLFHVVVAMELVLLAPFTKFAHALYRTLALYIHALKPVAETETAVATD